MISHSKSSKNWISPKISPASPKSRYLQAGEIKKRCEAVGELGWNIPWTVAPRWRMGGHICCGWKFSTFFSKSEFEVKGGCIHSCHVDFSSESHIILYQKSMVFPLSCGFFVSYPHFSQRKAGNLFMNMKGQKFETAFAGLGILRRNVPLQCTALFFVCSW